MSEYTFTPDYLIKMSWCHCLYTPAFWVWLCCPGDDLSQH